MHLGMYVSIYVSNSGNRGDKIEGLALEVSPLTVDSGVRCTRLDVGGRVQTLYLYLYLSFSLSHLNLWVGKYFSVVMGCSFR